MMQQPLVLTHFKNYYPFLGQVKSLKIIEHTNINSVNFLVKTRKGSYVLHKFLDRSSTKKIERICKIMNHCIKQGSKVTEPIKNRKGTFVVPNKKFFVTKYYAGTPFRGSKAQIKDAAIEIAVLHKTLSEIPISYYYRTNSNYYKLLSSSELSKLKNRNKKNSNANFEWLVDKGLNKISKISKKYSKDFNMLTSTSLKRQLIHHDLHPRNIIFKDSKVSAILDFNAMRKGLLIEDISFSALRFGCEYSSIFKNIQDKVNLFVSTYLDKNNIDEYQVRFMKTVLIQKILGRLAFILRNKYFKGIDLWFTDFNKNLQLLELSTKLNFKLHVQ